MTLIRGIDMSRSLTAGVHAVMTTNTVVDKRRVVYRNDRYPCRYRVAGITFQRGYNVRRALTGCDDVVMATAAHTNHLCMIYCASW